MTLTPREKLSAAISRATDARNGHMPYLGVVLVGLVRVESPEIPTLAVTADGHLHWNPGFIADPNRDIDELAWSLLHEAMHVVLQHHTRTYTFLGLPATFDPRNIDGETQEKLRLANLAQDACINADLRKIHDTPAWWVYPETLKQPEGWIFEQRLAALLKDQQKNDPKNGANGAGDAPDQKPGQKPGEKPGPGRGQCGSCTGHTTPGEPSQTEKAGRSTGEIGRIRKQVAEAVRLHAQKSQGQIPDSLARWADDFLAPPKIDWRTKLGQVVRRACAYRPGAVDFNWGRVSRRQAGLGFGVGRAIMPAYRAPVPRVGIVIDTSGSMSQSDINDALNETRGVLAAVGADVILATCDATLQGIREISRIDQAASLCVGGGGTDMRPAFDALQKHRKRPDMVVVITDGHVGGGVPSTAPTWCRVVWVLVGKEYQIPCPWAEYIAVDAL